MSNQPKSTLNRSETLERLNEIVDMNDNDIGINTEYIRTAVGSAINHILELRKDLEKTKRKVVKKGSDPIPLPSIKPGDKVRQEDLGDGVVFAIDQDDPSIAIVNFDDYGLLSVHTADLEVIE